MSMLKMKFLLKLLILLSKLPKTVKEASSGKNIPYKHFNEGKINKCSLSTSTMKLNRITPQI